MIASKLANEIDSIIDEFYPLVVDVRRHIHRHPELSFNEKETTDFLIERVNSIEGVNTFMYSQLNGFVADIQVDANKPTVLFRADIDALPIQETTGLDYASSNSGVMHACGHDVHAAIIYGTILILSRLSKYLPCNVRFIFQPAEEVLPGGAKSFIDYGVLNCDNASAVFGLHLSPEIATGKIGVHDGGFMASSDELHFKIVGKGGHAVFPSRNIDPVIIASKIVLYMSELTDEKGDDPHIAVIGDFIAHGATNVIPDVASLMGTMRTFNESTRKLLKNNILQYIKELEDKYSCQIENNIVEGYPVLINNHNLYEEINVVASSIISQQNVIQINRRMTADDFAYYGYKLPAFYIRLGCGNEHSGVLHSPTFNPDELCMKTGMKLFSSIALKFDKKWI